VRELGNFIVEASPGVHMVWGVALAILLGAFMVARGGGRSTNSQAPDGSGIARPAPSIPFRQIVFYMLLPACLLSVGMLLQVQAAVHPKRSERCGMGADRAGFRA
jgi:hypothetical protein